MTANEIYSEALSLLGYTASMGSSGENELIRKGISAINMVCADLCGNTTEFKPIVYLSDEVTLPRLATRNAVIYGTAMFLAQGENDGDNQQLFAFLYNRARMGACGIGFVESDKNAPSEE